MCYAICVGNEGWLTTVPEGFYSYFSIGLIGVILNSDGEGGKAK